MTNDAPFFYKCYKLSSFNPFAVSRLHHSGHIIFMTQALVLVQAVFFILFFILFPLYIAKKSELLLKSPTMRRQFITYFSPWGIGFMFIEIPLLQKFVLLLGSPIYSIAVTLAALLISTGIGNAFVPYLKEKVTEKKSQLPPPEAVT